MSIRSVALVASFSALTVSGLVVAVAGVGCRHDRPEAEPPIDVPAVDVVGDVQIKAPPVTVLVDGKDVPADLSCLGTVRDGGALLDAGAPDTAVLDTGVADAADEDADATADAADAEADASDVGADAPAEDAGAVPTGTLVEKEIELIAFGTGGADKLPGQTVDVHWYNTFTREPDVKGVVSDEKGLIRVPVPQGLRVAYHVRASSLLGDYYGLDDLHVPVAPAPNIRWQGVTRERFDILALAVTGEKGYELPPQTGIVAGRVLDCQRRYIQYATVILRDYTDDPAGKTLDYKQCGTGLCLVYLSDAELPGGSEWTSRSSLFAMIDVPSNRKLRAVALGTAADGSVYEIGSRALEVKDGAISTQFIEPDNP